MNNQVNKRVLVFASCRQFIFKKNQTIYSTYVKIIEENCNCHRLDLHLTEHKRETNFWHFDILWTYFLINTIKIDNFYQFSTNRVIESIRVRFEKKQYQQGKLKDMGQYLLKI
ncbi:hypothetical protein BpHYR1_046737 [Brachionus plicatilis]|uniref:Uncharacterized protein n=1 Tax=Brachionus plicatilis TaxID=10195 RepID=A0A3M7SEC4_BRAPC|nr:hypothetical protein BpHYR1_046737 [Brachionus plicatilis]